MSVYQPAPGSTDQDALKLLALLAGRRRGSAAAEPPRADDVDDRENRPDGGQRLDRR